jgi:hypothetical protein
MSFLILFALGALAVPLAVDISRYGNDNILRRSGRDLLKYPAVQKLFRSLHMATKSISMVALTVSSLAIVAVAGYMLWVIVLTLIMLGVWLFS